MDKQLKTKPSSRTARSPRKKSELTRQRILEAAATVFRDKGYAHGRISDVAEEAKTQVGLIYYYFDSREQLVEQILSTAAKRLTAAVTTELAKLPSDAGYRERINAAIRGHLLHSLSRDIFTAAFSRIHNQVSPELHDRYAEALHEYGDLWDSLIRDAQSAGDIRTDLDPRIMRLSLMGSMVWSLEWYRDGKMKPKEIAAQMSMVFFEGAANAG